MVIHGRSDAALDPEGVRIGTAEIYPKGEQCDEVLEAVCGGQDWDGDVRVVLFVVLKKGVKLTNEQTQKIRAAIRRETTPRHVPAKILAVADVPRTRSGEIAGIGVRKVINGEIVYSTEALANHYSLDLYRALPELGT